MYNLKKLYMGYYKQHYYFGNYYTTGVGIHTKPIRQMCSEQKYRRKAMYNNRACRQPENITCKQRCSGRYTKKLNDKFGQESPLTMCPRKVLEYLGIKSE